MASAELIVPTVTAELGAEAVLSEVAEGDVDPLSTSASDETSADESGVPKLSDATSDAATDVSVHSEKTTYHYLIQLTTCKSQQCKQTRTR